MVYTLLHQHFQPIQEDAAARAAVAHFGRTASDWQATKDAVAAEQAKLANGQEIKIVFLARHGHGEHNHIPEPAKSHWPGLLTAERNPAALDSLLIPIGQEQAAELGDKLKAEVKLGMPVPTKIFTSISRRTCGTAVTTWDKVVETIVPMVSLHDLRDTLCGKNFSKIAPRSVAQPPFPRIIFDHTRPEEDVWWTETGGKESHETFAPRVHKVFDTVWDQAEGHDCIAVVTHMDVLDVVWREIFKVEAPSPEPGEQRIVVIKKE